MSKAKRKRYRFKIGYLIHLLKFWIPDFKIIQELFKVDLIVEGHYKKLCKKYSDMFMTQDQEIAIRAKQDRWSVNDFSDTDYSAEADK